MRLRICGNFFDRPVAAQGRHERSGPLDMSDRLDDRIAEKFDDGCPIELLLRCLQGVVVPAASRFDVGREIERDAAVRGLRDRRRPADRGRDGLRVDHLADGGDDGQGDRAGAVTASLAKNPIDRSSSRVLCVPSIEDELTASKRGSRRLTRKGFFVEAANVSARASAAIACSCRRPMAVRKIPSSGGGSGTMPQCDECGSGSLLSCRRTAGARRSRLNAKSRIWKSFSPSYYGFCKKAK